MCLPPALEAAEKWCQHNWFDQVFLSLSNKSRQWTHSYIFHTGPFFLTQHHLLVGKNIPNRSSEYTALDS